MYCVVYSKAILKVCQAKASCEVYLSSFREDYRKTIQPIVREVLSMMKFAVAVLLSAVALATGKIEYPTEWHMWKAEHGVSYVSEIEELQRHIVWLSNNEFIEQHNKYSDKFGYTLKMNKFGDLSTREFVELLMCVQAKQPLNATELNTKFGNKFKQYESEYSSLPDSVDWRTLGAVTSVKDQLRCGCSYAFASMGALEGAHALAHGTLVTLSEQNIVDCSVPYGNHGCACGDINNAYLYVIDNDGVDSWDTYPFKSTQSVCKYNKKYRVATATHIMTIGSGDESSLQSAVATVGPISTYVDASHNSFQFYSGGVLDIPNCSKSQLSHSMVVTGYGIYEGKDNWLLKNSWGQNWGIHGYVMMARNKYNQCGVATAASFPSL